MTRDVSAQLHQVNVEGDMICRDACAYIKRCDLWKLGGVNKHHQQSCCGQKDVCTCVVFNLAPISFFQKRAEKKKR